MIRLCASLLSPLLLNDKSSSNRHKKMKAIPSRRFPQKACCKAIAPPASLFWCVAVMILQFTYIHSFVCRLKTLRNLRAHCSAVALCCVTINSNESWKVHFKLWFTIVNVLFRMWLLTTDIFDRWCSDTVTQWRSQPKFFGWPNDLEGLKCLILGGQQYFFGIPPLKAKNDYLILKILTGMAL